MSEFDERKERTILSDVMGRSEAARRRFLAREPKRASRVMADVMQRRGYGRLVANDELVLAWERAVDERLRPFTRAVRVYRGRLEVLVANSVVMQELTFLKTPLLNRFNQETGEQAVTEIRFRIGVVE